MSGFSGLNTTCLVVPTLDLERPDLSAPSFQHLTSTLTNNVEFGQVMEEPLPYSNMAQVPYPPLLIPLVDNLTETDKATANELHHTPSLLAFIALS